MGHGLVQTKFSLLGLTHPYLQLCLYINLCSSPLAFRSHGITSNIVFHLYPVYIRLLILRCEDRGKIYWFKTVEQFLRSHDKINNYFPIFLSFPFVIRLLIVQQQSFHPLIPQAQWDHGLMTWHSVWWSFEFSSLQRNPTEAQCK